MTPEWLRIAGSIGVVVLTWIVLYCIIISSRVERERRAARRDMQRSAQLWDARKIRRAIRRLDEASPGNTGEIRG